MTVLETPRCRLRELVPDDADALMQILGDPEAMRFSPMPLTHDRAAAVAMIDWQRENYRRHGYGGWAVVERATGNCVGHAGLLLHDVGVELFYSIVPDCWGRGLATEVAAACRDHAFDRLGLTTLIAMIHPEHARAIAVARKVGMRESGAIERWGRTNRLYRLERDVSPAPDQTTGISTDRVPTPAPRASPGPPHRSAR